jgi:hypothetical protein
LKQATPNSSGQKEQSFIDLFNLRKLSIILILAVIVMAVLGTKTFLFGFLYGVVLFLINCLFLVEGGKLISQVRSRQSARKLALLGFIGRYLFLAVMLIIAAFLPQVNILAACVGLLFAQSTFYLLLLISTMEGVNARTVRRKAYP